MDDPGLEVDDVSAAAPESGCPGGAHLLGAMELHGPGGQVVGVTRPQVQIALAFLLIERRPVSRGELADLLWGDRPLGPHWQGAVRGVLSKLRDLLAEAGVDGVIDSARDGTVRLVVAPGFEIDVERARAAVDAAEAARDAGRADDAVTLVAPWAAQLDQPFLAAGDGDWVRSEQGRIADLARRAASVHTASLLDAGRADLAAEAARAWVRRHPLDERVHEDLIRALVADGRRQEAIEAYGDLAQALADELGIGPSDAITSLVGRQRAPSPNAPLTLRPAAPARRPAGSGDASIFLGRRAELDAAVQAWTTAIATRRPGLVEIVGRSGIGKTRLAEELCEVARADGADVRWARCLPGTSLPFEPLASVVGATAAGTSDRPGDEPADPTTARLDALRAIGAGVRALAGEPAVLVVDDLQWAGDDMASALETTLVDLDGPLLVVTTGRNLPPGIHEVLARLERTLPTTSIRLRGLQAEDLLPLFDLEVDQDTTDAALAAELYRRTGGHPFFVSEMAIAPWRAGRAIDLTDVPDGIRDWIGHRADALPKPVRARLDLAAVIGDEFSVGVLARCAGVDPDEVLDQIERLVDEGIVVETPEIEVFAFAHLITRDAVYERIGGTRRARLHAAVAETLANGPPAPGQAAAVAHHLRAAGPARAAEAGRMLLIAGREALDAGAWAEAEQCYRDAGDAAPDEPEIRAGALTGTARGYHLQRRRDEAEDLIEEVLVLTRAHRLPLEFADAVLVLVGRAGRGATQRLTDLEQADLLREALAGLEHLEAQRPVDDLPEPARHTERVRRETLACRVEGELANALALTASIEERGQLAQRAVARARALDPPDTRLTAWALLVSRLSRIGPADVAARIDDIDQVLAIAPAGRSVDATLAALTYRHEDLALCGRRDGSRRALDEAVALAERSQHPYWSWATAAWRGLEALIDGDLDEAEARAFDAAARQGSEGGAQACLGVNLVNVRLYQGRSGEVLELLEAAADAEPHIPCYRAVLALCAAEAGDTDLASRSYEPFRSTAFDVIPYDTNRLLSLVVLADTAAQLGDADSADVLRELLLPAAGLQSLLNCYGGGGAYWGPVDHQLARLERLAGRPEEADRWFATSEASAAAFGAPLAQDRISRDRRAGSTRPSR